jgi:hypothetical protein
MFMGYLSIESLPTFAVKSVHQACLIFHVANRQQPVEEGDGLRAKAALDEEIFDHARCLSPFFNQGLSRQGSPIGSDQEPNALPISTCPTNSSSSNRSAPSLRHRSQIDPIETIRPVHSPDPVDPQTRRPLTPSI